MTIAETPRAETPRPIAIKLKFHGPMQRYLSPPSPSSLVAVELEPGQTLAEAVRLAGFPLEVEWSAVVGDRIVSGSYRPQAGDTITILPPLAGG